MVDPKDEAAYHELERHMNEAIRRGAFDEYDRLSERQKKLGFFRPHMTHSFSEKAHIVVFHSQLVADFNTIDELAWKLLEELDRPQ